MTSENGGKEHILRPSLPPEPHCEVGTGVLRRLNDRKRRAGTLAARCLALSEGSCGHRTTAMLCAPPRRVHLQNGSCLIRRKRAHFFSGVTDASALEGTLEGIQ